MHQDLINFVEQLDNPAPQNQSFDRNDKSVNTDEVIDTVKTNLKDLSYGRLCSERKIFLNKSNTKWLTFGLRPSMGSDFRKEIRLYGGSQYIILERYHLSQILDFIKSLPQVKKSESLYSDAYEYGFEEMLVEPLKIERGPFNDTVLQISDSRGVRVFLGLVSLQQMVDIENVIFSIFDHLNVALYTQAYNDCLIEVLNHQVDERFFEQSAKHHALKMCRTEWASKDILIEITLQYLDFMTKHAFKVRFNKN